MSYMIQQAMTGRITGAGARGDMDQKLIKQGIDIAPRFSIFMGLDEDGNKVWRSYAGAEPIGGLIAIAATIGEAYKRGEPHGEEWEDVIMAAFMLPLEYINELPFAHSLIQFTGAVRNIGNRDISTESSLKSLADILAQFAQVPPNSTIPFSAIQRAAERHLDPTRRDTATSPTKNTPMPVSGSYAFWEKTWNTWASKAPGLSKNLPAVRNVWGEVVKIDDDSGWAQYFVPFRKKLTSLDDVEKMYIVLAEMNKELPFAKPRAEVNGIKITPAMHENLMAAILDRNVKERMREVIDSREFIKLQDQVGGEATAKMAGLLSTEYDEIKTEAIMQVFGYDEDRNTFRSTGDPVYDMIGQALLQRSALSGAGYPTRTQFDLY